MWLPNNPTYKAFLDRYLDVLGRYCAGLLDDAAWSDWANQQLRRVVGQCKSGSPFYATHLRDVDDARIDLETLHTVPFTTKHDLREQMMGMLSRDIDEACFFYETTGTTGPATPCPRDAREVIASNAHVTESWGNIFDHVFPNRRPRVGLMGPTEVHSFGDTLGDVARNLDCCIAKIWPYSPVIGFRKALQLMQQLQLDVVCCTPGVALTLAKAAKFYGYDPARDFSLKALFVTGEMCTPALARQLDAAWAAQTYNILYGSQEALVIASACRNRRMHLARPNYIAEVVDPDSGAVLGHYGDGELVVTMLIEGSKPLIRYRTGDQVRITPNDCGCGISGPIVAVVGRTLDRVILNDRRFLASDIETAVLSSVDGCLGYQVAIAHDGAGNDVLTVRLDIPSPGPDVSARVGARVMERLGTTADVEIVSELDPVTNTGAFVSWKAARLQDTREVPDHEAVVAGEMSRRRRYRT